LRLPEDPIAVARLGQDRTQCGTAERLLDVVDDGNGVTFREDRQHALLVLVLVLTLRHHRGGASGGNHRNDIREQRLATAHLRRVEAEQRSRPYSVSDHCRRYRGHCDTLVRFLDKREIANHVSHALEGRRRVFLSRRLWHRREYLVSEREIQTALAVISRHGK